MGIKLVFDATPLIYLSKIGFWKHLQGGAFELLATSQVLAEIRVSSDDFPELATVRQMIETGKLKEIAPEKIIKGFKNLHEGEASAISLAKELGAVFVADDSAAIAYAKSIGLKTAHSSALLAVALKKRKINFQKARQFLDQMIDAGWYCDTESYKRIIAVFEKYK